MKNEEKGIACCVTQCDYAKSSWSIEKKFASKPHVKVLCEYIFDHKGNYHLIISPTDCAGKKSPGLFEGMRCFYQIQDR